MPTTLLLYRWLILDPVSGKRRATRYRMVEADGVAVDPGVERIAGTLEARSISDDPNAYNTSAWQNDKSRTRPACRHCSCDMFNLLALGVPTGTQSAVENCAKRTGEGTFRVGAAPAPAPSAVKHPDWQFSTDGLWGGAKLATFDVGVHPLRLRAVHPQGRQAAVTSTHPRRQVVSNAPTFALWR